LEILENHFFFFRSIPRRHLGIMADQLLEKIQDIVEGQIDFEGQRLAELGATALLATTGVRTR
jgi:hypothetical protein